MADISLRDYLAKLENLLDGESAPEVILHARHILQHFPLNAHTYRLLGRSLAATSRWAEAADVMRRVLSVFPDDKDAHMALSEAYRLEKRTDDAIWHLERAFEQEPNDEVILENLRELYRKHRKVEHGKVQLTAGAVARQYARSGMYEQAVDTLQKSIAADPQRHDLRLLLARTFWDSGRRVEAGSAAVEVLKSLPDCLVANSLMAALWLTESRPSDAQRYINRIQSLDPYLALELARGEDVPDNTFMLPELDYEKAAERELVAQTPDWLKGIDAATAAAMSAHLDTDAQDADVLAGGGLRNSRTEEAGLFDDLEDSETLFDEKTQPPPARSGLTGRLNQPETSSVPGPRKGLTGRLTPPPEMAEELPDFMADLTSAQPSSPIDEALETELPDWLLASAPPAAESVSAYSDEPMTATDSDALPNWLEAAEAESNAGTDELPFQRQRNIGDQPDDPLAWLRESGIEVVEDSTPADDDLFDAEDDHLALQPADAADPLSWMSNYGGKEMLIDSVTESDETGLIEDAVPTDDSSDPLEWLNQSNANFAPADDELPAAVSDNMLPDDGESDSLAWLQQADSEFTAEESAAATGTNNDPLDWLTDDAMLDEALNLETLLGETAAPGSAEDAVSWDSPTADTPEGQNIMPDEKDPMDWLSSDNDQSETGGDELFTWADEPAQTEANLGDDGEGSWLEHPVSLTEGGEEAEESAWDEDDTPQEGEATQPVRSGSTGMLDWLNKSTAATSDLPPTPTASENVPDWLSEMQVEGDAEAETTAPVVDENGFEWMSQSDEMPTAATPESTPPDWLSELRETEVVDETSDEEPLAAAEVPDWLTQTQMGDESLVEAATVQENVPDWLSEMQTEDELPEMEAEAVASDTPDWLSEMQAAEAEPAAVEAGITDDTPDWLSEMQTEDELPEMEAEAVASDTPDWLNEMQADEAESEPEALAAEDTPDWMADLRPVEASQTESAADEMIVTPEWLSADQMPEIEEPPEPDTITQMPSQIQDWVASVRGQGQDDVPDGDTTNWLDMMHPEDEGDAEPMAMADDAPEWLAGLEPEEPEAEPAAVADDAPEWLADLEPEEPDAEPMAMADDAPEWLAGLEPEEPEAEPAAVADDAPEWLAGLEPEEPEAEPAAVADDTPEWLADLEPEEPVAESAAVADDTPEWLSAMRAESGSLSDIEGEPEVEANPTPDWLVGLEPEEPKPEPEPIGSATPDWLVDMQQNEEETAAKIEAEMSDTPEWLTDMQSEETAEPQAEMSVEEPDWLSAMQAESGAEVEPEPLVNDTPDWLAEMQPDAVVDEPLPPVQRPVSSAVTRDLSDWSVGQEMDFEPPAITNDEPDWLTNMAGDSVPEPDVEGQLPYEETNTMDDMEEAVAGETPDWLSAMRPAEANHEWDINAEEEHMPAAPAPAQNAPDWLNAMVPGLDVDYGAEEDEQLETGFLPGSENRLTPVIPAGAPKPRPEYNWLLDLVQEESQQARSSGEKARRFVFSRPPAWLRTPTEVRDEPADEMDADVDVPPWLQ
ncbi:MAG: tetratricopeptide repeat protein [Anaerolineae bacterium]